MKRVACGLLLGICLAAQAQTYKCLQGGKTVFSDVACPGGGRVDQRSDAIDRDQRRQAELVDQKNRSQLAELEYRAARDRHQRVGGYNIIDSMNPGDVAPGRRR